MFACATSELNRDFQCRIVLLSVFIFQFSSPQFPAWRQNKEANKGQCTQSNIIEEHFVELEQSYLNSDGCHSS